MLSVYYDKICIKFASHHLYVVYMYQKSLNFTYAFKCYQQNVSGFTLAGPPCISRHCSQGFDATYHEGWDVGVDVDDACNPRVNIS